MSRKLIGNKGGAKILKLFLMYNYVEFEDSIFDLGWETFIGEFFNIGRIDYQENIKEVDPVNVY